MSSAPAPPQRTPDEQVVAFAAALLEHAPEHMHALLWTRQDKRSHWVPLADSGAGHLARQARELADEGRDVYVAVSVARQPGRVFTRIASENSAGLVGLWADLDFGGSDAHKKWNLPPDEAAVHELLDSVGARPSLLVHSGHGLQAWWLFSDFWEFESDEDRLAAAQLAQRWNTTLRVRAAQRGWVVDSVFDLARVMRVPGTLNRKREPVVPVRLLEDTGLRYSPDDLDQYTVDDGVLASMGIKPTRSYQPDALDLAESAFPHPEKLDALIENDQTFERTWKRRRTDLADGSASSYDMSLASQAASAGWTDQEIADLIIAWRRKHQEDVAKALRADYVGRTIARARDGRAREASSEAIEEVAVRLDEARLTGDDDEVRTARRAALDVISQQLGIEVTAILKYTSEPPTFRLVTPTHAVDLGGAEGVLTWLKFRQSVWALTGVQVPRFKQARWDELTELIPRAWEEQDVGLESTEQGEVYSWLSEYLSLRVPVESAEEAAISDYPFLRGGQTCIFGASFRRWLWVTRGERVDNRRLGAKLRAFGCVPDRVNVRGEDAARTSRSVWVLPEGWQR